MASNGLMLFALAIIYCFAQPALCNKSICSPNLPSCEFGEKNEAWCCPYKNGVCCNDSLRICCPEGTSCISDVGLCMPRNYIGLLMTQKLYSPVPLFFQDLKNRPANIEICPSKTMICPSKSTCCPAPYIGYDCCPLVHGNCCGDFKHCCPFNTTCDINRGMCVDAYQNKFPWMKKTKAETADYTRVKKIKLFTTIVHTCPDRETRCEHHHTCCPSSNGKYECCAFANGVCCPDAKYCCPAGTVCDNSTSECTQPPVKQNQSTDAKHLPIGTYVQLTSSTHYQLKSLLIANLTLICPGGQYSCPDYMTCCPTAGHKYGCCPFPNAVCCSDNWHCCPSGSQCDVEHDKCIRGGMFTPLFEKTAAAKVRTEVAPSLSLQNQQCPDQSQCPDRYTCCQMLSSKYGCCPLDSATCCSDKIHCCPHATVCDLETGRCSPGNSVDSLPLQKINAHGNSNIRKVAPSVPISISLEDVICPDKTPCPDNSTCCQVLSSGYGCCLMESATCCSDKLHCCPHATVCDLKAGRCIPGYNVEPMPLQKISTTSSKVQTILTVSSQLCPDKETRCGDNQTCCAVSSSRYACCPWKLATCCSDQLHCCPHATICDLEKQICKPENLVDSLPLQQIKTSNNFNIRKMAPRIATSVSLQDVICPDKRTCPDNDTCCQFPSSRYGCCPFESATCCSDKEHCCPHATVCDLEAGKCRPGNHVDSSPLQKISTSSHHKFITPASRVETTLTVSNQLCPDKESKCGDNETCCVLSTSDYGCCAYESATCCSDKLHCCPHGFVCDLKKMQCNPGNRGDSRPLKKISEAGNFNIRKMASRVATSVFLQDVICPDKRTCPDNNTCCQFPSSKYGCCPFESATCCSDKEHCCPHATVCDLEAGKCRRGNHVDSLPLQKTSTSSHLKFITPASKVETNLTESNQLCPDKESRCGNSETCCLRSTSDYWCCAHELATCCSDELHCCPHGFVCDLEKMRCTTKKYVDFVPLQTKIPKCNIKRKMIP